MYPNVEAERTRAGILLVQIAEELNITTSTASLKLNGKYQLTFNEAKKIKDLIVREKTRKGITVNIDMTLEELFEVSEEAV
jgi:hypothetical protein